MTNPHDLDGAIRTLAQALWVMLPVIAGGLVHVAVIKLDLWPSLAALSLDLGACFRQRRIFGSNKTVRGLLVMPGLTALFACLQVQSGDALGTAWAPAGEVEHPVVWGLALGLGYVLGELPNSFIKRQLDVPPGEAASGRWKPVFWVVDQLDGLAGAVALMCLLWLPPATMVAWLVLLTLIIHPAVAGVMVLLRLKQRVG